MNSCATTLNVAMRLLWPERFPSTSARSLLRAFEEGGMRWPQVEGPRVILWEKLERFAALTHTVGNFAIIPWREGNALNKAKNRTLQDCLAGVGSPRDYEESVPHEAAKHRTGERERVVALDGVLPRFLRPLRRAGEPRILLRRRCRRARVP